MNNNKKNIKKLIIFNIIGILSVLVIIEFISFWGILFKYYPIIQHEKTGMQLKNWVSFSQLQLIEEKFENYVPTYVYKGTENNSIVLLGCSYAWGAHLNYEDKPSSQIAKHLKKTVYNKSICGMGTNSALYIMSQDKIMQEIPHAKYFIYVFLTDHLRRNHLIMPNHLYNQFSAKYSLDKNNNLKFNKFNKLQYLLFSSYTYRLFEEQYMNNRGSDKNYVLFGAIMDKLSKIIKEKYPESEFIVLFYNDNPDNLKINKIKHNAILDNICKRNNIKLIYTSDLKCGKDIFNRKYLADDNLHPSKEAWENIIPEFTEKAGIK